MDRIQEIINPWVKELSEAFAPYPEFVRMVTERLKDMEGKPAPKVREVLVERDVLLIDDAEVNRVLFSHYFKGLPVRLEFASTLQSGIGRCKEQQFDLLVVDIGLQDLELKAMVEALKESNPGTPLVAFGAGVYSDQERSAALFCGFSGYVSKGLPKDQILELLSQNLWAD